MKKTLIALSTLFSLLASIVSPAFAVAQTVSPTTQPLVQQADMVYLGKFTVPAYDNANNSLDYGSFGLGMGADGQSIYFGCHDWYDMIARVSIPAIGGTGTVQMPCTAVTNKLAVNPGDVNGFNPGGTLVWNNKLIVTMYPYYDAGGTAVGSHFTMTPNMTSQAGPFRVGALTGSNSSPTDRVGMQSGYMGIVPAEWRSLLGAPAFTGQMGIPIIGRTSFGPSLTVFDPDQLGVSSAATKLLVGYPGEYQTLGGYSQANTLFSGADQLGGAAFPAGTRTVLFVGRHATTFCYGEGTTDPALDRQPVPGWNGQVIYCYDPTSLSKGTHGWPYIHQVWAYDANDLLAVKNGIKNPWDLRPYATWKLSDINNSGSAPSITSATYDPATKKFYMAIGRDIHVYQVNVGTAPTTQQPTADLKVNGSDLPVTINSKTAITLSWSSTNATSCTLTGGLSGTSGTQSVTPTSSTTYTLSCTGAGGTASDSVSVTVNSVTVQSPTADIKANGSDGPISVPATSGVSLTWTSTNATSCSVNPGAYSGLTGTQTTSAIEAGRTFVVSCTGAGGTASDSVVVNPSSTTGGTVNVSTIDQLKTAVANLTSNQTIVLANGTYNLTDALYLPQNISNVTIKGSGRDTTIVQGNGMTGNINFGFWMDNVKGVTISDMTIRNISQHGIIANSGVDNPTFRNLRITDIGDQFIKNNPTNGQGVDNGILENSILEYTTYASDTYTNGLDVHYGKNWVVRGNTFKNFRSNSGLVGPAVLFWNGSSDTIVERNTFINNHRDISLGLDNTKTAQAPVSNGTLTDHARGVIANNFIYRASGQSFFDVPVAVFDSPSTKVYNNTIISSGMYPNSVEYRFSRTTGVDIKNNLIDGLITARDGATATLGNNVINAVSSMFVSPTTGDLHLTSGATSAIDKGVAVSVTNDFDNQTRPLGSAYDVGADETQSSGGTTDTTKPTVTLTAPSSYTAIKGVPILVSADATDNVGVVGVQFKLDGANLNTEDTTSAYSTIWDTTNASEGPHTLTAVARDAAGNTQTSSSVTVTISVPDVGDTTKPTVNVTSPEYNSEANSTISLSAEASDDVGVAGVQFKVDGVSILSEDNVEPYSISWNTSSVSNGSHSVTAVARDLTGNLQESGVVVVRVQNDVVTIVPPTVSLTSPTSGSTVSNTVIVSANAEDDKGVVGVQFKLDGVNLLPEDTTAPYSISWNTLAASNGSHKVTATARDVEGNQTTSDSRSVTVSNSSPTPPPPTSLKVGDKVKTTTTVSVRSSAGGRYLGSQRTGKTGTITSGPGYANSLTWWKVNFASGVDGWVAANYLTKSTVAMTDDDYRKNIANIYLIIKYLQERVAGQN